jgi:hypothetical protein
VAMEDNCMDKRDVDLQEFVNYAKFCKKSSYRFFCREKIVKLFSARHNGRRC